MLAQKNVLNDFWLAVDKKYSEIKAVVVYDKFTICWKH